MATRLVVLVAILVAMVAAYLASFYRAITLGELLSLLAILAGFVALFAQHHSATTLQRDANRDELRMRVFEILTSHIRKVSSASSAAKVYALLAHAALNQRAAILASGTAWPPVTYRAAEMLKRNSELQEAAHELLIEVERWETAIPTGKVFRLAFVSTSHDNQEAFFDLHTALLRMLPMERDAATGELFPPPTPSADELEALERLVEKYATSVDDLTSYSHDLRVQMQNEVLQPLFGRTIEPRVPLDPACLVVSAENAESLLRHFTTETPYARNAAQAQNEVRRRLDERL